MDILVKEIDGVKLFASESKGCRACDFVKEAEENPRLCERYCGDICIKYGMEWLKENNIKIGTTHYFYIKEA